MAVVRFRIFPGLSQHESSFPPHSVDAGVETAAAFSREEHGKLYATDCLDEQGGNHDVASVGHGGNCTCECDYSGVQCVGIGRWMRSYNSEVEDEL